ncbi:polysaccharide pyruvyl transferase family protein [Anaerostipes faecalis]|uniref:polysaccharide pyruvyl transferase family protein n=1 Tax=Anaerostipes faecalis TaxID=2738446 RepID=UPI003EFE3895
MRVLLYGNGSSGNHGCEAIVRGMVKVIGNEKNSFIIASENKEEDMKYGLSEVVNILPAKSSIKKNWNFIKAYLKLKFMKNYTEMDVLPYLSQIKKFSEIIDIALSIGGDNYCYGGTEFYARLNEIYHNKGIKTILWGCSIEPKVVLNDKVIEDLKKYDYIVARESITYEAIRNVTPNVTLVPDSAFAMNSKKCELDKMFVENDVVGINISPMIISNETHENMAYLNYQKLVQYILEKTDYSIALIPHVVWENNDDRKVLEKLYREFYKKNKDRILMISDHSAEELKYIISQCRFFVGARTHATIAAYSSKVPTLVVGYSVKARGIAKDIFGQEDKFVIPVQRLEKEDELTKEFIWMSCNEDGIKERLNDYMIKCKEEFDKVELIIKKQIRG